MLCLEDPSEGNTRPPDGKTIQAELGVIRLLADENVKNNIVRGVRLRNPRIDLVRVQDVGLSGANDPSVLEWAAGHQRVLLTHDVATITAFAYERVRAGKPMPGII
jgi:predicted nuclease of predicted toxin-antitoxin system